MMTYTIDANILISAHVPTEAEHPASKRFVEHLQTSKAQLYCPTLMLVEIASALIRTTKNTEQTKHFIHTVELLPNMTLIAIDERFAQKATETAIKTHLRGADAIYVTVAQEYDARLVTWDKEMLARAVGVVQVVNPEQFMAEYHEKSSESADSESKDEIASESVTND